MNQHYHNQIHQRNLRNSVAQYRKQPERLLDICTEFNVTKVELLKLIEELEKPSDLTSKLPCM